MFTTTQNLIACNVALPCFNEEFNAYHLEGDTNGQFMAYLTYEEAKRAKALITEAQPHLVVTITPSVYTAEGKRLYTLQDNETDLYAWELLEEPAMDVVEVITPMQQRFTSNHGSLQNIIESNNASVPVAGTYCTELMYTDRYVYFVREVSKDGKTAVLESCRPKYVNQSGYANGEFHHEGYTFEVKWRYGKWVKVERGVRFTKEFMAMIGEDTTPVRWLEANAPELLPQLASDGWYINQVVARVTEPHNTYHPIRLKFGVANYYRDPQF